MEKVHRRVHRKRRPLRGETEIGVEVGKVLGATAVTVINLLNRLEQHGIIREISGRKRNRRWAYTALMQLGEEGAAPLP